MTEKTIGGKTFQIQPLTRGEVRRLRKEGFNLSNITVETADEVIDKVLEIALGERFSEVDDLINSDAIALFKDVVSLTFGGPDPKNS